MYSIGIVIPYFGTKPGFYDAWEITALANSSVDFYVFTDIRDIKSKGNINAVYMSLSEFRDEIQRVFDFPVCLDSPYKLCDYKPVYGNALKKWIGGYDFWGYCDLDMLLGDLRVFFSDEILSKTDRCFANGHISLWRNNDKLNSIYKYEEGSKGISYKEVYSSPDSFYFDEQKGVYSKSILNGVRFTNFPMRDPMEGEPYFVSGGTKFVVYWQDGKLYSVSETKEREEICYAHFFRRSFNRVDIENTRSISSIKVVPGSVRINEDICDSDYLIRECSFYKFRYKANNLIKSLKRYGLYKTFKRQYEAKKNIVYVKELEDKYSYLLTRWK